MSRLPNQSTVNLLGSDKMRRRLIEFLILLMVATGAGPVGAAIWQWSTTSSSNASADPSINWREGQSPSSVNDSARAMMSALAQWRNDISVTNATAGTSTAYTLTTSEGVSNTPSNGQMLAAIFHATNGSAATLQVDGGNVYQIQLNGIQIPAGTLIAGSPYRFSYNSAATAWVLEGGFASPFATALGGIMLSTAPTPPNSNFVAPYGQCISTTTYAAYWVQQGSPASGACPGGQFAIIDMRGSAPVMLDTLPGSTAANRLTSSATGCGTAMTAVGARCANGVEGAVIPLAQLPASPLSVTGTASVTTTRNDLAFGTIVSSAFQGGANSFAFFQVGTQSNNAAASTGTITGATANLGSGTARPNVMPSVGLIPYLRIL